MHACGSWKDRKQFESESLAASFSYAWADSDSKTKVRVLAMPGPTRIQIACRYFSVSRVPVFLLAPIPQSRIHLTSPSDLPLSQRRIVDRCSRDPTAATMAGTTVLPPSLLPHRTAAATADLHSCSSRVRVNPALMANPAAAKKPKRPGSVRDVQPPPAKRIRGACSGGELHVAVPANIKNGSKLPSPSSGKDPLHSSAIKKQVAESPASSTESKPQMSMRQLIEKARLTMALLDKDRSASKQEASRRQDIERSRAEARRKVEQMVDTVQFNDPWIHHSDVTKSPEELLQARQHAWRYQAHLLEKARRRDFAQAMQIHG
ncbi:hypothetical protein ACQJBY_066090 [Aegilops geniculata]